MPIEELSEGPQAGVALTELLLQVYPGDELRSAGRNAVQPLGEPAVRVERHRRVCQGGDGSFIERHGEAVEAVEIIERELQLAWPEDALAPILLEPEIECAD